MTDDKGTPKRGGYGRGTMDADTRKRIRGWLLYEMKKRDIVSIREMARKIGVAHTYVTRVLNEETTPGLEFVVRMHRTLHISMDTLCDEDPPPTPFIRW
jgi:transcriptional regulator with XRE-family HTH domain